jgi:hypothetical protein
MDGTCSKYGRNQKCVHNFGQTNLKGRDFLEDLDVDKMILN